MDLTGPSEAARGVKQGCPLTATLYILAIPPLFTKINNGARITGTHMGHAHRVTALSYTYDITVIIENQTAIEALTILTTYRIFFRVLTGFTLSTETNKRQVRQMWKVQTVQIIKCFSLQTEYTDVLYSME